MLFCPPPVNSTAYPPVRWWWVHWSFYIQPQFCRCSHWSERWYQCAAQALLLHLDTGGCWEASGGKTGLGLPFGGGVRCRSFWGCVCVTGLRVCPILSLPPALLSHRPREPPNGDYCGSAVAAPSVFMWDRQTLEDNLTTKVRLQLIGKTNIAFVFHLWKRVCLKLCSWIKMHQLEMILNA